MTNEKTRPRAFPIVPIAAALAVILFVIFQGGVSRGVADALTLSVKKVIPAVFPSAVAAKIFVASGGGGVFRKISGRITGTLFSLPGGAAAAILLGMLCGFPIGAVTASELYEKGEITRPELERLVGFCSLPSPAFVINSVGGMLGSRKSGLFLYLLLVTVSLGIGIVSGIPGRKKRAPELPLPEAPRASFPVLTASALSEAASAMLGVTACTVFFSALCSFLPDGNAVTVFLHGVLEFSGGCAAASELPLAIPLCAFFLGWSGFSVHFQIASVLPRDVSQAKYYLMNVIRGTICFAAALVVSIAGFDIY